LGAETDREKGNKPSPTACEFSIYNGAFPLTPGVGKNGKTGLKPELGAWIKVKS